jgi:hypothetical protein
MILVISILVFLSLACATLIGGDNDTNTSGTEEDQSVVASTPTPTPIDGGMDVEPPADVSRCESLSGELEMQVLVGPADAVGLTPVSTGVIPFSVVADGGEYSVQGGGAITYEETLTEQWGTFTVRFDMQNTVDGDCAGEPGSEMLNITIEMSGEQMVEVRAEGFQGDYPWSGTLTRTLSFPLEEGATQEGEGWAVVLHLSN